MGRNAHAAVRRLGASAEVAAAVVSLASRARREGGPPWTPSTEREDIETVVIGAGQAGLSTGYHLAKRGREFVILDSYERVGDNWRCHWDSLRLYSPALAEACPACGSRRRGRRTRPRTRWPTSSRPTARRSTCRSAAACGWRRVSREGERYLVTCTDGSSYRCDNVVVATGTFGRTPNVPAFAGELDPAIRQLHSSDYKRPSQLQARRCAGGRGVALGRRHRVRGGLGRPPGGAQRTHPRGGAVPAREAGREGRVPGPVLPGQARAHDAHPDRAQDARRRSGRTAGR